MELEKVQRLGRGGDRTAIAVLPQELDDNTVLTKVRMIPFQKSYLGLKTIFRAHGSALPRTLLPALLSGVVAVVVVVSGLSVRLSKHVPDTKLYVIFTSVTGFALVFRTQAHSQIQLILFLPSPMRP